ncbi:hypothetical protein [Mycolicibacterium goodii]|uniref:Uncharacterized protein n=1 Tax=Mycolicibacterium goodii TaxID=134601 RepID=A0ABS6HRK4_MYCGD|nr:hypothetical protein [Mycolicibacterium goodii]MBU8808454.1 hypothetical protein [Mycolicibacterium goodii]MBU8817684.1 hypothetical protein [Mycolicibacterium goodii]MBU8825304.1 hypothetical protein [Mycolicibacterium goodii]MBU8830279.1 hypothetical protein [Mycolicibacterium goodii]MBU8836949.1 hypothetical protein [Mycolicibacterium goodii]
MGFPVDNRSPVHETAREWQKLQLAALGFVGLCGVLGGDGAGAQRPLWLEKASGVCAVAGLVLAVVAVTIVATVAFPLGARSAAASAPLRRLRVGIGVTFLAVGLTALASLSTWWPDLHGGETGNVHRLAVATDSGSVCGTLLSSGSGTLDLQVDGGIVRVPLKRVLSVEPVFAC